MKTIAATILACVFAVGCKSSRDSPTPAVTMIDDDYILALSVAEDFLAAWQHRDQDKGLGALSPRLLKSKGEQWWRDELSGISNPHHESYEITNGRPLPDNRYVFDVWLYEHYTGESLRRKARGEVVAAVKRSTPDKIILIQTGPEEWKVDEAPDI